MIIEHLSMHMYVKFIEQRAHNSKIVVDHHFKTIVKRIAILTVSDHNVSKLHLSFEAICNTWHKFIMKTHFNPPITY